jgi:hypothetical protein
MWSRWFDHVGRYLEDEWYGEAMRSIVIPIRAEEARQLAQMFEQIADCLKTNRAHACLCFTTLTDDVGWFWLPSSMLEQWALLQWTYAQEVTRRLTIIQSIKTSTNSEDSPDQLRMGILPIRYVQVAVGIGRWSGYREKDLREAATTLKLGLPLARMRSGHVLTEAEGIQVRYKIMSGMTRIGHLLSQEDSRRWGSLIRNDPSAIFPRNGPQPYHLTFEEIYCLYDDVTRIAFAIRMDSQVALVRRRPIKLLYPETFRQGPGATPFQTDIQRYGVPQVIFDALETILDERLRHDWLGSNQYQQFQWRREPDTNEQGWNPILCTLLRVWREYMRDKSITQGSEEAEGELCGEWHEYVPIQYRAKDATDTVENNRLKANKLSAKAWTELQEWLRMHLTNESPQE